MTYFSFLGQQPIYVFSWILNEFWYEIFARTIFCTPEFIAFHEVVPYIMDFGLLSLNMGEIIFEIMSEEYTEEYSEEYSMSWKF